MSDNNLNPCNDLNYPEDNINFDPMNPYCGEQEPSLNDVSNGNDYAWNEPSKFEKEGYGIPVWCDPMLTGQIVNELENPNRNVIYRNHRSIRGCDEAIKKLFGNIVVIDEDSKAHRVPIIWASQERAVAAILQNNVRKDNTLVVDRIRLPILSVFQSDLQVDISRYVYHMATENYYPGILNGNKPSFTNQEKYPFDTVFGLARGIPVDIGYTLYAWTKYEEDINQINTQIITKFSPNAYIRVDGIRLEIPVMLDAVLNNIDTDPGEKDRVIKYQYNLTVKTYIPQPIKRNKTILKTKIDIFNDTEETEIKEVLSR